MEDENKKLTLDERLINAVNGSKFVLIGVIVMIGFIFQSYFLFLSSSQKRDRALVLIEKSPMRIVARWDNTALEEHNPEGVELAKERWKFIRGIFSEVEFKNYKFNETLEITINTLDAKTDDATVKIDEAVKVDDKKNKQ